MLLVRIDDIAAAKLQQGLALEIDMRLLDRRWITEPDSLTVVADTDLVPVGGSELVGPGTESRRHDVADVALHVGLEAVAKRLIWVLLAPGSKGSKGSNSSSKAR